MNPIKRLAFALLASSTCAAVASTVTIISNNTKAVLTSSAGTGTDSFTDTGIPTSGSLDVTLGDYYSRTQIDYTESGNNVTLLNSVDQKRSEGAFQSCQGYGMIEFMVAANSTFSLSGAYSATDVGTPGVVRLEAYIYDFTLGDYTSYSYQFSQNTSNESFVLGASEGDFYNETIGSLTGNLIAGHAYLFAYFTTIQRPSGRTNGASATGFVRLDIGEGASSAVPDGGATLGLLGLAIVSLAAHRRKVASV